MKKKLYNIIISIFFCTSFFNDVASQSQPEFSFEVITSENSMLQKGLSANTVYAILQDSYGYLWFGTWSGLNKFDGYRFIAYDRKDGLSNETINALIETDDGNIWIGTDDGLNCLRRADEKVLVFKHDPGDSTSISNNKINFLSQDSPERILVGTDGGVNVFDRRTYTARPYRTNELGLPKAGSNQINYMLVSSDGIYWTGTNFGLVEYNPTTHTNIRHLNRDEDPNSLSDNRVRVIFEDHQKRIWAGTENGLCLLNRKTNSFTVFRFDKNNPNSLSNNFVECLFEDSAGNFWIGTDGGGLNTLSMDSFTFTRVESDFNSKKNISKHRIYSIMEDSHGSVWFGTFNGVNIWDRFKPRFNLHSFDDDNPQSLNNNFVWAFLEYRPHIVWVGTDEGISVINTNTHKFNPLSSNFLHGNKLSSNRVRALLKDSGGNIWIGTRDAGLNKLETKTGKIDTFQPSIQYQNSICHTYILALFEDSKGIIWVGTQGGLNTIDPVTHQINVYKHDPNNPESISNNTIYDFLEDAEGNLWIATLDGLNLFHHDSHTFSSFKNVGQSSDAITTDRLFCLFEDSENNFWIGTRGGGLELFDRKNYSFQSYTTDDGLPNNVIYGVLEDNNRNLWMSTNWGISMFDKAKKSFVNFDVSDGLQSNEFNARAYLKSIDGDMFFGGMKGFNVFSPESVEINPCKPDIVITSFKKFNKPQPGQLNNGDTIVLSYDENFFSFEFSSLDYINAFRSKYGYILENYNRDWTYVDGRRHFAEYTNVGQGTYTFRVIGANNNGIWNSKGVTLTIVVQAAWHQTLLFKILIIVLILSLLWLIVYSRVRTIHRKHLMEKKVLKIEKQLFEIQQKALRLQMNPHFIFNSLNSIQSFILTKDIDLAVNYLSRFSQLMRLILANSRESIIPLADEIKAVKHYLEIEKLRFDNKFDYTIDVDPEIDEEFTGVPPMIIQPYVENSIIHGLMHKESHGTINICFKRKGEAMLCTITDDGIGRKRAMEIKKESGLNSKSRGMMITKERLEILNSGMREKFSVKVSDIKDKQGNTAGTEVELLIVWQDI